MVTKTLAMKLMVMKLMAGKVEAKTYTHLHPLPLRVGGEREPRFMALSVNPLHHLHSGVRKGMETKTITAIVEM